MPEKLQQNINNPEKPKTPESELSPEVLEKVMAKVQDINEEGTAYTVVGAFGGVPKLEKILEEGLLGATSKGSPTKENWALNARHEGKGAVYFNIVGKGQKYESQSIKNSHWVSGLNNKTIIIFDLSHYKETETEGGIYGEHRTFKADEPLNPRWGKDYITTETGYKLFFRVAPRYFQGLVTKPYGKISEPADQGSAEEKSKEYLTQMQRAYKGKNELLVPIYDVDGNLYWPKKMSYEEVKKFVEERDKNKKEKNKI